MVKFTSLWQLGIFPEYFDRGLGDFGDGIFQMLHHRVIGFLKDSGLAEKPVGGEFEHVDRALPVLGAEFVPESILILEGLVAGHLVR